MIEALSATVKELSKEISGKGKEILPNFFNELPMPEKGFNPDAPVDTKKENLEEIQGGAYKDLPNKEGFEKHHMPADSTTDLPYGDGPCINMERSDHRLTASCGNSIEAQEYREAQRQLVSEGKFKEALQMDIDDIKDKFGDKYDKAIEELKEYTAKLELEGRI